MRQQLVSMIASQLNRLSTTRNASRKENKVHFEMYDQINMRLQSLHNCKKKSKKNIYKYTILQTQRNNKTQQNCVSKGSQGGYK